MQTGQQPAWISRVFPDVVDVQRVSVHLEILRKHFFTSVVEFTSPSLCVEINAVTFHVKFTAIGAYLKTGLLHRFYHVTNELMLFDRLYNLAQVSGMDGKKEKKTGQHRHSLQWRPVSYKEFLYHA